MKGARDAPCQNFFIFMQFAVKNCQIFEFSHNEAFSDNYWQFLPVLNVRIFENGIVITIFNNAVTNGCGHCFQLIGIKTNK